MRRAVVLCGIAASLMTGASLITALALSPGNRAEASAVAASQPAPSPAGTWFITATNVNTGNQSTILAIMTADGSFQRVGVTHPVETPGYGAWAKVGALGYEITYMSLQFDTGGGFIGSRKSWIQVTMDASFDEFTGVTRGATYDPEGNVLTTTPINSRLHGVRFRAEPFSTTE